MTKKLVVTVGVSGSGKTFWAEQYCLDNVGWFNVNRDNIRKMFITQNYWTQGSVFEEAVTAAQTAAAKQLLNAGFNVIVSDANLQERIRRYWQNLAIEYGAEYEEKSFLDVPFETCLERDKARVKPVGESVLKRQAQQAKQYKPLKYKAPEKALVIVPIVQNPTLPRAILVDCDGTACLFETDDKSAVNYRNPHDESRMQNDLPNVFLRNLLHKYALSHKIVYVSGRKESARQVTEEWLVKHNFPFDGLFMRKLNDNRKDYIIKEEIYREHIVPNWHVDVIFDDREVVVSHARKLGFTVYQVAQGDF